MQLYIDGLSDSMTEQDLLPLFSPEDSIASLRVIRDIQSGDSRGFALAMVTDDARGQAVITRLNGAALGGRKLTVFKIHDTLPGEMEFREWMREKAEEVLGKAGVAASATAVDYGCGPGIFSLAAARLAGPRGKVIALDVRPKALEKLKETALNDGLTNLETMLIDRSTVSVPLADGTADVVLLYDVLQEIADKVGLLRELCRILRREGVLSIFPMHLGTERLLELVRTVGLFDVRDRQGFAGFHSASEIVNLVKRKP